MRNRIIAFTMAVLLTAGCFSRLPATASAASALTAGTVSGSTYENESVGLGCTLEGWRYDSLAELMDANSVIASSLPEDLSDLVKKYQSFLLMNAYSQDGESYASISVSYFQDAETAMRRYGMESMIASMEGDYRQTYLQQGYPDVRVSSIRDRIGGKEFPGFDISYTLDGITVCSRQLMMAKGDFIIAVTVQALSFSMVQSVIGCFYLLDDAGSGVLYTGRRRPVTFEVPRGWVQGTLTREYGSLEAKFLPQDQTDAIIQYSCLDLVLAYGLNESDRKILSAGQITENDAKGLLGLSSDFTFERKTISGMDCFEMRGLYKTSALNMFLTAVVFIEEGYLHVFFLYDVPEGDPEHENALAALLDTLRFPEDTAESPPEDELTLGTIRGDTYENAFFGFGCVLPGWRYDSAGELMDRNQIAYDSLPENMAAMIRQDQGTLLMFAAAEGGLRNVNLSVSYLEGAENTARQLGMRTIAESLSEYMLWNMIGMGRYDAKMTVVTAFIGGEQFYGYDISYSAVGGMTCQRSLFFVKGDYVASLVFTADSFEKIDEIVSAFYLID